MIRGRTLILTLAVVLLAAAPVVAQKSSSDRDIADANNPLANMVAFNIQNYYYSELYGTDATTNTAWLRYAQPFGRWLMRASLPLPTSPDRPGVDSVSGVGDFNVFFAYLVSDPSSPKQFGIGPLLAAPTATNDALGADTWQAGAALVYFDGSSKLIQWGGLLTYQTDFSGDGEPVNMSVLQPFLFIQLGKGVYTGTAPLWLFDFESNSYSVPLGVRLGKVMRTGHTVFNVFVEPQVTILHDGVGQPKVQFFAALNIQFLGK